MDGTFPFKINCWLKRTGTENQQLFWCLYLKLSETTDWAVSLEN